MSQEGHDSVWLPAPASLPAVVTQPAPTPVRECVTFRDQELACQRECRDIRPRLVACFAASSPGRRTVHVAYRTVESGIDDVAVAVSPRDPVASQCVRDLFEAFVPCLAEPAGERREMSIPIVLGRPAR